MTKTTADGSVTVHFLRDGMTYVKSHGAGLYGTISEISRRGQTVTFSPEEVELSRDRNGHSWLDLADDADAQTEAWGKVYFAPGPFPATAMTAVRGSVEWEDAYADARRAAWEHPEGVERTRALAELREKFGPPPVTSKTLGVLMGDEERRAVLEDEERA